jgi:uncharacterized membrane protein YfcA
MPSLLLAALVAVAFAVETAAGFGSMVVLLTLGGLLMPLPGLMAVAVPVNLLVSAVVMLREPRAIAVRLLLLRVLPAMLSGLSLGVLLGARVSPLVLQRVFALFVIGLAVAQLLRRSSAAPQPVRSRSTLGWLAAGGVAHGAFAAAGPLVVHAIARELPDKRAFRATLAALWLTLNLALVINQIAHGLVTPATLSQSALLLPATLLGMVLGEQIHRRLEPARFLRAVHGLMLAGGAVLLLAP